MAIIAAKFSEASLSDVTSSLNDVTSSLNDVTSSLSDVTSLTAVTSSNDSELDCSAESRTNELRLVEQLTSADDDLEL